MNRKNQVRKGWTRIVYLGAYHCETRRQFTLLMHAMVDENSYLHPFTVQPMEWFDKKHKWTMLFKCPGVVVLIKEIDSDGEKYALIVHKDQVEKIKEFMQRFTEFMEKLPEKRMLRTIDDFKKNKYAIADMILDEMKKTHAIEV